MRPLTVRWRLTAAFAAVMALVLTATGLFVYQRQATNLNQTIDRALRARAADVAALAQQSDTGLSDARPSPGRGNRAELAQLIDASGRVLDRTPGLPGRPLMGPAAITAARHGATVVVDAQLADHQPVRLLAEPVHAQDQKLVIIVGQSLQQRNLALLDLRGVLLVGGPIALMLASIAGYLLTGAALRPVETMRRQAANISATDLDQRLPEAGNDELGRLACTLNEMLTRIHTSVERERTLVSDASHELRTPLAVLRTELELIGRERPTGLALQAAIGSAIEETDRLSQLADDLLLLARADDHQLTIDPNRLAATELLNQAADRARRQPNAAHKQITTDAPDDTEILADQDRVSQAIDNLLTNALRHANTRVHLSARPNGAFVALHVIDDGPGFPPDFLPHAWERFTRADTARTEDGTGLGLAIVRTIAEAHNGQAYATNSPGGGADVWITFPIAPQADQPAQPGYQSLVLRRHPHDPLCPIRRAAPR
jgi:two-component system, OmpR family, sensor kinase